MIEETIQWFRPGEKLPEEHSLIMFISNEFYYGFYKNYNKISDKSFHLHTDFGYEKSFYKSDIKYWAYLPKGPE